MAREEIRWQVEARTLDFDGWRARLVLDRAGDGWLGGSHAERRSRHLLWRLERGRLIPSALPGPAARAYVLDVDSTDSLWIAPYDPEHSSIYDGSLTIARLPADVAQMSAAGSAFAADAGAMAPTQPEDWKLESITPGLWPQAMAMAGPDAGWIGANHARLLERTPAGWRESRIELEPGVEALDLNVLDLALSPDGGGVLVGSRGLVARLDDGVWRQVAVPASLAGHNLRAVDLTPDGSAWIAGSGIARWHPSEGWRVEQPTDFALMGIDMVNDEGGWAVGLAGTILERRGGRWLPVPSPVGADLFDIAMHDSTEGWITGYGLLLRGTPARAPLALVERTPVVLAGRPGRDAAVADIDDDGDLDLLLAGPDEVRIFPRGPSGFGAGPVLPRPSSPYAERYDGWAVGDADGDGAVDLLLLSEHGTDRHLYRNNGSGGFTDASSVAGLGPFTGQGNAAYWVDLDTDGDLDLYVSRGSLAGSLPLADRLYVNDGLGRFVPRRLATGDATVEKTVLWGDLDGDDDLDAVIPAYHAAEARLYRNDGGALVDATSASGLRIATPEVKAGAVVDLDRDGDLDLVLAGHRLEIHRNDGFGHGGRLVHAASVDSGISDARAVFCHTGDLDHDGLPELLVHWRGVGIASTKLLARDAGGRYRDVGEAARSAIPLTGLGPLDGAVLADLDGDGDLDPLLTGPRGTVLLEGRRNDRRWLRVRLHGHRGSVVGTAVRVRASGVAGPLLAHVHAAPGSSVLGEVHTGLSDTPEVDVEVRFPGGRRVIYRDVPAGSRLDAHDTVMPWRLLVRGHRTAARRLAAADPRREALKLGIVLAVFGAFWVSTVRQAANGTASSLPVASPVARALRRRALGRVATMSAGVLLVLHPAATLALAPVLSPALHAAQVAGMAALAAVLRALERRHAAYHIGAYRLGPLLGEGGMGVVHRARHVVRGHDVALKLLHPHLLCDETSRRRFLREARLMAAVSHSTLVCVEETGEIDGRGFIAMELLEGCSLARYLAAHGPLPAPAWLAVAQALAEGVAALYQHGIVHRDLKSENVFVLDHPADAWACRVRIMDLGLAWSEAQAPLTHEGALVGTVATMAPERLHGARADARGDLWSLGVVYYQAATGRLPFDAADGAALVRAILSEDPIPPRRWNPAVAPSHEALILALLARDPAARPESAHAVAAALVAAPPPALETPGATELAPSLPAADPTASSASAEWLALYDAAREHAAAGRLSQADVALVACLRALRARAARLDGSRRTAYLAQRDVRSVLELSRRLERGGGQLGSVQSEGSGQ